MACTRVWACTRVHLLSSFLVPMNVYVSRVWCLGPAVIASGCECVPAEPQGGGGLIAAGSGSSYRLPGSHAWQSSSSQAPPRGLLRSFALPKGPATRSSACFVQQTSLGGGLPASIVTLWDSPYSCARLGLGGGNLLWLQAQDLKLYAASNNVQKARPILTERVNIFIP